MKKRFFGKALAFVVTLVSGMFTTGVLFFWFAAGEIYDYHDDPIPASGVDVVLCLAGGKGRVAFAFENWWNLRKKAMDEKQVPPVLFLSGVGGNGSKIQILGGQGIDLDRLSQVSDSEILYENVSQNTFENVQIFATFVRQNQWKKVMLVTAGYHMRRAEYLLMESFPSQLRIYKRTVESAHFDRHNWHRDANAIRVTWVEYIKWLFYRN